MSRPLPEPAPCSPAPRPPRPRPPTAPALTVVPRVGARSPWQQPDNPDPKGINLRLLARALRSFVEYDSPIHKPGPYAVFIDFMSLNQKGPNGEERSEAEAELFSRALSDMMAWWRGTRTPSC